MKIKTKFSLGDTVYAATYKGVLRVVEFTITDIVIGDCYVIYCHDLFGDNQEMHNEGDCFVRKTECEIYLDNIKRQIENNIKYSPLSHQSLTKQN